MCWDPPFIVMVSDVDFLFANPAATFLVHMNRYYVLYLNIFFKFEGIAIQFTSVPYGTILLGGLVIIV